MWYLRNDRARLLLLILILAASTLLAPGPPPAGATLNPAIGFPCPPCNDSNVCTIDSCDATRGICKFEPVGCDDGNPCTKDLCYGVALGSPCGQAGCCHLSLMDTACEDGNSCTVGDHCTSGVCVATNLAAGTACDDRNPCTGPDTCNDSAQCLGEVLIGSECDDQNVCTYIDFCDETGSCFGIPFDPGIPCEDGNACTVGDFCEPDETGFTVCRGNPVNCSDGSPCTEDQCSSATGECSNPPVNCEDGNPCTGSQPTCTPQGVCDVYPMEGQSCSIGPCQAGFCDGFGRCVPTEPLCDDRNVCTDDVCDASTGTCAHHPTTDPCDDSNQCTFGDNCAGGSCTGTLDPQAGCNDANACTFNDNCATGSCMGTFDARGGVPALTIASVVPQVLSPVNHRLVEVSVAVSAQAGCGGALTPILVSVTSNQPDDAPGPSDGNTVGDIQGAQLGAADYSFFLRAERDRNSGPRIYTITYTVTSSDGIARDVSAIVTVPGGHRVSHPTPQDAGRERQQRGGETDSR